MFRTRYASGNSRHNYIRQRYNTFNISSTGNEKNLIGHNEDEEMTPAIDTESEEATEVNMNDNKDNIDDIELESEYERMMTELNESDEDNNREGEDDREKTSEHDSDEEVVIDQPLNNEQMPRFSGDFAPYFKNITESLFFCWMEKHHICK